MTFPTPHDIEAVGTVLIELFHPEKHYRTIANWWTAQGWPVIPLSHLSQTGIIALHEGKPAAAAWLYKSDSAICWLEWIVANPEIRHEARGAALSNLISAAKTIAESMGFVSIFMSISNESLARRIESHGFAATDTGMKNYICTLGRDK